MNKFKTKRRGSFLEWLCNNRYITAQTYYQVKTILDLYNTEPKNILKDISYFLIKNKYVNHKNLRDILKLDGFVFMKN